MTRYPAYLAVLPLTCAFFAEAAPARAADAFAVDAVHSSVVFKIQHFGISSIFGRFDDIVGDFNIDKQDPAKSSFTMTIKADSIDTNNPKRDAHLRSPDFFNTKQFPMLTFKSTSVKRSDGGYEVAGDMTMHGVTKRISFVLHGGKEAEFPKGAKRIGFTTQLTLRRSEFGMDKFTEMLSDDVHVEIGLEAVTKR